MTFAHELQHFVQYAYLKPLWAANTLLINLQDAAFTVWWDFPIEIEARLNAKRIAEELFGRDSVREFLTQRINEKLTDSDAADWSFIRGLDTSCSYDLWKETSELVKRHRAHLERALEKRKKDRDFAGLDLDILS